MKRDRGCVRGHLFLTILVTILPLGFPDFIPASIRNPFIDVILFAYLLNCTLFYERSAEVRTVDKELKFKVAWSIFLFVVVLWQLFNIVDRLGGYVRETDGSAVDHVKLTLLTAYFWWFPAITSLLLATHVYHALCIKIYMEGVLGHGDLLDRILEDPKKPW